MTILDRLRDDHGQLVVVLDAFAAELKAARTGRTVSWDRALACLDYCENACDKAHHPIEDLVHARMRDRDLSATDEALGGSNLHQAHETLIAHGRHLRLWVDDMRTGRREPSDGLYDLAEHFLTEYREHMAWEERTVFPAADRILMEEDWSALDRQLADPAEPVVRTAAAAHQTAAALYDRIDGGRPGAKPPDATAVGRPTDVVHRRAYRYGDLMRDLSVNERAVSYNHLTPKVLRDDNGNEIPQTQGQVRLRSIDMWRLLSPYVGVRIAEQLRAVLPLAAYLALFQLIILRQGIADGVLVGIGLAAVIVGLMMFMEGLKLGLMPFAEVIGDSLPKKQPLVVVLTIVFLLGIGVTFAEPAIGALQAAGALVDVQKAPYLWSLLNQWAQIVVLVVGAGVGLAAVMGTLRVLGGWSLKPYIYASVIPVLALTVAFSFDDGLSKTLGLAWDCGAVTTGPVTVPLVLSLGIGIASAAGKGDSSLSGFGVVTLASLFPILAVMLLALYVSLTTTPEAIMAAAASSQTAAATTAPNWFGQTPMAEIVGGVRAVVPLVLFLFLVLRGLLRAPVRDAGFVAYGLVLCVIGMCVFNIGLTHGLAALGSQSGSLIPGAFQSIELIEGSPLYTVAIGIPIAILFAWVLGFGATLAEPALNALGITVENLTNGAFRKRVLMYAVSTGVAFGIVLGVLKIVFAVPILYLLVPFYIVGLVLTALSSEEFVNVAWDSAGVTTGPVTVPLVLAMGLGLGDAVDAVEGFGILSMASICPIISVLTVGLWIRRGARTSAVSAPTQTAG